MPLSFFSPTPALKAPRRWASLSISVCQGSHGLIAVGLVPVAAAGHDDREPAPPELGQLGRLGLSWDRSSKSTELKQQAIKSNSKHF